MTFIRFRMKPPTTQGFGAEGVFSLAKVLLRGEQIMVVLPP